MKTHIQILEGNKQALQLVPRGLPQRKCACGNHTVTGEECAECAKNQNGLQRKFTIGAKNDPPEREADLVADQVLVNPTHSNFGTRPPNIQCFPRQSNVQLGAATDNINQALASHGRPLESSLRQDMEQRFGYDFSQVRVHSGSIAEQSARDVHANAYTLGHHIVFGTGRFAPGTHEGRRLIAHELTHVVQQSGPNELRAGQSNRERGLSSIFPYGRLLPAYSLEPGQIARDMSDTDSRQASGKSPVVLVRINIAAARVTFVTTKLTEYTGTVDTDLKPGNYKLTPKTKKKLWAVTPSDPGLRFYVKLENADPWALSYSPDLRLEVEAGNDTDKSEAKVLGLDDTVDIKGDPAMNTNYVQNAFQGVGIYGWGGPFRLDHKIVNGMGTDSILIPRCEFDLDTDPLKDTAIVINTVYKTREAAKAAVKAFGRPGAYAFYIGPGGHIYPTIISDTTAPALCQSLRKAIELERSDAKAAENLSVKLLLWYVGARYPIKASEPPTTGGSVKPHQQPAAPVPQTAAGSAGVAASGGKNAFTVVEIGAGDLKAAIELAKKGGAKVVAVDPVAPSATAIKDLQSAGGTFIKGTAETLSPGTADHVFQYFPWRIGGTGSFVTGGTWRLVANTIKLLKPGGAAHFVTEDLATAEFLTKEASTRGLKAALIETTAGAAAPGASGVGVPNFTSAIKVWLVNIYK
jgi:hypothetical protein